MKSLFGQGFALRTRIRDQIAKAITHSDGCLSLDPLAEIFESCFRANGRKTHDADQVITVFDRSAVEFDDHVVRVQPREGGRTVGAGTITEIVE